MLRQTFRETMTFDRSGLALGHALRRSYVLWAFLLVSVVTRRPELAIFPIVGAFVVGFGSIRALGLSRATPMFFCSLGIALSTLLGSLMGASHGLTLLCLALAGLGFGLISAVGPGTGWVALNCLVFFLVLGLPYPAGPREAARNALLVLAGGLGQSVTLTSLYVLRRRLGRERPGTWLLRGRDLRVATRRAIGSWFRERGTLREALVYGLRMALALELGQGIGTALHLQRSAWILMTSALVLKPDLPQTLSRGAGRCAGTLAGGLLATVLAAWWQPGHTELSVLLIVSAMLAYLFFYVNYALSTVFITGYVVFLLAFAGLPGIEVAYLRVLATLLGGALAVAVYLPPLESAWAMTVSRRGGMDSENSGSRR